MQWTYRTAGVRETYVVRGASAGSLVVAEDFRAGVSWGEMDMVIICMARPGRRTREFECRQDLVESRNTICANVDKSRESETGKPNLYEVKTARNRWSSSRLSLAHVQVVDARAMTKG
ncbi:hypothetical protein VFPBJ_04403 [Purpureocillium lilacinum]|uniref:Uncharacterized protein n=2 Tax=Purpureocillium lilacinum TaxID=33203 RepID=A0A179GXH1_PURLI|nr:hypothetical protein VFPBJ_04403 [Purpureocillium lilacinum]